MLPGWQSLERTAWWSSFFTYAGWFALFSLGVFEILTHVYSIHERTLSDVKQKEVERQRDEAIARADRRARGIEAQVGLPRQLNSSQEDVIARLMRPYKDAPLGTSTMIDVSAYGPDPEAIALANQIVRAIGNSGCKVTRDQPGMSGRAPLGILVEFRGGEGSQWMYIAAGLVAALKHAGLFVLPIEEMEFLEPRSGRHIESPIRVTVGKR